MTALRSTRAYPGMPGDDARVLTYASTDAIGRRWPAGTVYRPISGGAGGHVVTVQGERVTFNAAAVRS